jgi:hydroxyacylglutathione hydrolase
MVAAEGGLGASPAGTPSLEQFRSYHHLVVMRASRIREAERPVARRDPHTGRTRAPIARRQDPCRSDSAPFRRLSIAFTACYPRIGKPRGSHVRSGAKVDEPGTFPPTSAQPERTRARRVGDTLWLARQDAWETTSILLLRDGACLACGPGFDDEAVDAACEESGVLPPTRTYLLVTHMDFDHLGGIGRLEQAEVVGGAQTQRLLADPEVVAKYRHLAEEWGGAWRASPRIDRIVGSGSFRCGPFAVEALPAPGHTDDAIAYLLPDDHLFLPGDYVSPVTYPFVTGSLVAARTTHERLLAVLDRTEVRLIVPGHGSLLDPDAARQIAGEDLEYLERLAVVGASTSGLPAGAAFREAYAVEPPRSARAGFEALGMREANARRAVKEARESPGRG